MKINATILSTIVLLGAAIYVFVESGRLGYPSVIVLATPLVISFHPVFRMEAKASGVEPERFEHDRKLLNQLRWSLFALGAALFVWDSFFA